MQLSQRRSLAALCLETGTSGHRDREDAEPAQEQLDIGVERRTGLSFASPNYAVSEDNQFRKLVWNINFDVKKCKKLER